MTKGEILAQYKNLSPEDRRSFDRWLRGNAVVGSIFGVALVAIALGGLQTQETATAPAPTSPQTISVQELLAWHISTIYGSITSTIRPLSSAPRSLRRALRRSCKIASQVPTTRIPNMRQRDAATLLEHSDVNDQIKKQVSDLDHTRSARTASMIASREYATRWVRGH
jgi:hypothetical protein